MLSNEKPFSDAMALSITTFSITTLSITTLSITTFSKTTFSIKSLSIQGLYMTLSINYTERNWTFSTTMLCTMLSVIMVNVTFYLLSC